LWILLGGTLLVLLIADPVRTLNNVVDGLSIGAIWALIALGYTLVYGIIELINFAHGEVFMIGSFVSVSLYATLGMTESTSAGVVIIGILAVLVVSMFASGALNVMIERVAYRPLRNAPKLAPLITAIGMSFILQNVGLLWRSTPDSPPDLIRSQQQVLDIGGVTFVRSDFFAWIVTIPLLIALLYFVGQTKYGKAMRATAQDPDAARLMGINVDRTIGLTFLLGGLLAGAAGLIYALYNGTVQFNQGFTAGLIAFTAAVMGGIGNLKGAVIGGLIIGIIQQTVESRVTNGSAWAPVAVFAILVMVMVFRPSGLFGEETREG
jgi:branched-chain amino acid transport system permease protein